MLRQLLRPLRVAQPLLARPFSLSAVSQLPAAKLPKTTKAKATTGSGQGGASQKTAALELKLAKIKEAAVMLKRKLKESEKATGKKESTAGRKKIAATKKKDKDAKVKAATKAKAVKATAKAKKAAVDKKPRVSHVIKAPKAPSNTWQLFLADYSSDKRANTRPEEKRPTATSMATEAAPLYRALAPTELVTLAERFAEEKAAYPAKYAEWMKSLTPEMIKAENTVRFRRRKLGLGRARNLRPVGEPVRPLSAFFKFAQDVRTGEKLPGALEDIQGNVIEQSRVIASGWKALSEDERSDYVKDAEARQAIYATEKAAFLEKNAGAETLDV